MTVTETEPGAAPSHDVTDLGLAHGGVRRVEWAEREMPVLRLIRERFATEQPLRGLRIGACLHVTSETANLVRTLAAGGAEVALCASNPFATQDAVAAALAGAGTEVHAVRGDDADAWATRVAAVVARGPRITLDDGADLLTALHLARPDLLDGLLGGTEETTTGLVRPASSRFVVRRMPSSVDWPVPKRSLNTRSVTASLTAITG